MYLVFSRSVDSGTKRRRHFFQYDSMYIMGESYIEQHTNEARSSAITNKCPGRIAYSSIFFYIFSNPRS